MKITEYPVEHSVSFHPVAQSEGWRMARVSRDGWRTDFYHELIPFIGWEVIELLNEDGHKWLEYQPVCWVAGTNPGALTLSQLKDDFAISAFELLPPGTEPEWSEMEAWVEVLRERAEAEREELAKKRKASRS